VALACLAFFSPPLRATSNHTYKPGEYVVIADGRSPEGHDSIAAHGDGDLGYDNFAGSGPKIGAQEEIEDALDTSADAFHAQWSADSRNVSVGYRVDRHVAMRNRYRIENSRAFRVSGPTKVSGE
jgi:hypothetical protein